MKPALPPLLLAALAGGCTSLSTRLPKAPPPLRDLERPLERQEPPADEAARQALPPGGFTGIHVAEAAASLEEMAAGGGGLEVARVVENSPADLAGVTAGDLLLAARPAGATAWIALAWKSEWRRLELELQPGSALGLRLDRAGALREVELAPVRRARPAEAPPRERFLEEERVGAGFRTATEAEARAAGLGPGGGAVLIALSRQSPWRRAGLTFGDLIVRAGGREVAHPQALLQVLREAAAGDELEIVYLREGETRTARAPVARRAGRLREVFLPPLFHYERDRDEAGWSLLLGLLGGTRTPAAWRFRLLWLFTFSGGDSDRLEEAER